MKQIVKKKQTLHHFYEMTSSESCVISAQEVGKLLYDPYMDIRMPNRQNQTGRTKDRDWNLELSAMQYLRK